MYMPEIVRLNDRICYIEASDEPLSSHVGIVKGDSAVYLYDVGATLENLHFLHTLGINNPIMEDAGAESGVNNLASETTASNLFELTGKPFDIVVSHFHADHTWWLTRHREGDRDMKPGDTISTSYERPKYRNLYVSQQTAKYTCADQAADAVWEDSTKCMMTSEWGMPHDVTVRERIRISDGVRIEIIPMPSTHAKGCLAMMVDDEYLFMGDASYGMRKDGSVVFNAQLLKEEIELLESLPADKLLLSHERRFVRPKEVVLRQMKAVYVKREKSSPYITV